MSMNEIIDAQAEVLGMLMAYPKLMKCCYLVDNHFQGKYKVIFAGVKKSIAENGSVMFDQLAGDGADIDLVLKCQETVISGDMGRFNHLQGYINKKFKERLALAYADELKDGKIDLQDYLIKNMKLMRSAQKRDDMVTADKIMNAVKQKDEIIQLRMFPKLSSKLDLYQRDFMVLAGSTGSGKTAFAINLLIDLSHRYPCLYFNMEMSEKKLYQRMIAAYSGIPIKYMRDFGSMGKGQVQAIENAAAAIGNGKIELISESCSIQKIMNLVASFNAKGHFIVFIDHIGLISSPERNSYERMNTISKGLRRISLDFDCTVIGLCQVNRRADEAETPSLSLLRDSGEIEQSARKVIFVWNRNGQDMVVIEKNDSGAKARIDMEFDRNILRFKEK